MITLQVLLDIGNVVFLCLIHFCSIQHVSYICFDGSFPGNVFHGIWSISHFAMSYKCNFYYYTNIAVTFSVYFKTAQRLEMEGHSFYGFHISSPVVSEIS